MPIHSLLSGLLLWPSPSHSCSCCNPSNKMDQETRTLLSILGFDESLEVFPVMSERTWWSNRRWRGRPEGKPLTRIFWLRHPDTLAIPWPMAVFWFMTYTGPSSSTSLSSSSCQCCHTIAVPLYFIVIYTVLQWHLFEILLQLSPAAAEWWYGMVRHKQNKTFPASR